MSKHLVRVRALSNVMGLRYGDVVEVVATPRVETLIRGGHLEWVDEDGVKVVQPSNTQRAIEVLADNTEKLRGELGFTEDDAPAEKPAPRKGRSPKASDDE